MSTYLPPTDNLPIFNPSVFQNGTTEGITLSEADTRYVKKSGSIMTGALSTPSLLVNSIDVETQLNKISSLETKTTDITFAGSTTTIANNLDIDGILSTTNITNLENDILANNAKTGITTSQANEITANTSNVSTLQTKTTDMTYDTGTSKTTFANNVHISGALSTVNFTNLNNAVFTNSLKTGITTAQANAIASNTTKLTDITFSGSTTTIADNLDIEGVLSTPSIANIQRDILANTDKIATLGSAYVSWQNSIEGGSWGDNNRLDSLETNYQKLGTITISENSTRDGAVDIGAGTYRIKVTANVKPRQTGSISIPEDRIDFVVYLSIDNADVIYGGTSLNTPSGNVYIRQLDNNDQGYGNNLSFEKLYYFSGTTELSIKTQLYSNDVRDYTGTMEENNLSVQCLMVVEKISDDDIETSVAW